MAKKWRKPLGISGKPLFRLVLFIVFGVVYFRALVKNIVIIIFVIRINDNMEHFFVSCVRSDEGACKCRRTNKQTKNTKN